jgi:hypothetical protein
MPLLKDHLKSQFEKSITPSNVTRMGLLKSQLNSQLQNQGGGGGGGTQPARPGGQRGEAGGIDPGYRWRRPLPRVEVSDPYPHPQG